MQAPFDLLAENYDFDFTETAIGRMQRAQVFKYLDSLEFKNPETKKPMAQPVIKRLIRIGIRYKP